MSKVNRQKKQYGWDNASVAFGNPLDFVGMNERKRKKHREEARKKKKAKGNIKNRKAMVMKHDKV